MKITILICFLMLCLLCISAFSEQDGDFDWPRWRGPNGNGISMETDWDPNALAEGPKVLWKADIGMGHSSVAIRDNRLYTMGFKGVFCLDAETGKEIWRFDDIRLNDANSTLNLNGKYVYGVQNRGIVFCLKAKNGKLRWKTDLREEYKTEDIPYGYAGSPMIDGDLIILNVNTAGIALSKKRGNLVWASPVHTDERNSYGYHATPLLLDHESKRCALILSGVDLSLVEIRTGKKLWRFRFTAPGAHCADPVLCEDKVFISAGFISAKGVLVDMSGDEPRAVWENKNMRNEFSKCLYIDGYLYGSDGDHGETAPLRCIDVRTGEVMWEQKMKMSSLAAADGKLIILEETGILHVAEATPSSYIEISRCDVFAGERRFRTFYTPPVLCNGKIYCRNGLGELMCIDVR